MDKKIVTPSEIRNVAIQEAKTTLNSIKERESKSVSIDELKFLKSQNSKIITLELENTSKTDIIEVPFGTPLALLDEYNLQSLYPQVTNHVFDMVASAANSTSSSKTLPTTNTDQSSSNIQALKDAKTAVLVAQVNVSTKQGVLDDAQTKLSSDIKAGASGSVTDTDLANIDTAKNDLTTAINDLATANDTLTSAWNTVLDGLGAVGDKKFLLKDQSGAGLDFYRTLNKRFVRHPLIIAQTEVITDNTTVGNQQATEQFRSLIIPYNSESDSTQKRGAYVPRYTQYTATLLQNDVVVFGEFSGVIYRILPLSKVLINFYIAGISTTQFNV